MKTRSMKLVFTSTIAGAALAIAAPEVLAQEGVASRTGQQVAMEKALADGPTAVRRYIERTRMIYALTWADFYKVE
jgi:hypothetical protein